MYFKPPRLINLTDPSCIYESKEWLIYCCYTLLLSEDGKAVHQDSGSTEVCSEVHLVGNTWNCKCCKEVLYTYYNRSYVHLIHSCVLVLLHIASCIKLVTNKMMYNL